MARVRAGHAHPQKGREHAAVLAQPTTAVRAGHQVVHVEAGALAALGDRLAEVCDDALRLGQAVGEELARACELIELLAFVLFEARDVQVGEILVQGRRVVQVGAQLGF